MSFDDDEDEDDDRFCDMMIPGAPLYRRTVLETGAVSDVFRPLLEDHVAVERMVGRGASRIGIADELL